MKKYHLKFTAARVLTEKSLLLLMPPKDPLTGNPGITNTQGSWDSELSSWLETNHLLKHYSNHKICVKKEKTSVD